VLIWSATTGVTTNAAVVPVGGNPASLDLFMNSGLGATADLIIDVNGYYAPAAAAGFVSSVNKVATYPLDPFVSPSGMITSGEISPQDENLNAMIVPTACTADFNVAVDVPTGGTPITFTLRVNGVDSSASCQLLTTSCASLTGAPLAAGDKVTLHLTGPVDYGAANTLWLSMKCQ
jgi:hypothetical protein